MAVRASARSPYRQVVPAGGGHYAVGLILAMGLGVAMPAVGAESSRLAASVRQAIHADAAGPAIIGHRGASALLPEHTLAAYGRAIADGADFIEPDLVMTRDGVLVARHENEIGSTTDVASHPEFAGRRRQGLVDGVAIDGWFAEDFSFEELRRLRAVERLPELRGRDADGRHRVPSLAEIIAFTAAASEHQGRDIGIVPEIKHSSHLHALGFDPERAVLATIGAHAYSRRVPFGIQSFEVGNLRRLRTLIDERGIDTIFLVQLIGAPDQAPSDRMLAGTAQPYRSMLTPDGLADIASYADVLAPPLRYIVPVTAAGELAPPTPLVAAAHQAGLAVHAWTLRPENHFLPAALRCAGDEATPCMAGTRAEAAALTAAGVDALFTDDPGSLLADRSGE